MKSIRLAIASGAILATTLMSPNAVAQSWPSKSVTIVVPFSAGGPTDFIARIFSGPLSEELGQPVVVVNRPGASGTIAVQGVKEGAADGYTLVHTTIAAQALNPVLYPDWKVSPPQDFVVVGTTAVLPNVLVTAPSKGMNTVEELITRGKAKPDALSYATFGVGTSPHILGMLLQKAADFQAVAIPYKGSAPALLDVMAGEVDFSFDNITTSAPQVQAGKIKALAIAAPSRSRTLPDVPTLAELGYEGFDLSFGFSLSAPSGVPADVISRLQDAFLKVSRSKAYAEALQARGAEPLIVEKENLSRFIQDAETQWVQVADELNLKGEKK